jgi:hypothetical protein
MKKTLTEEFQDTVEELHIWNRSILDIMTKLQIAGAKVNRTAAKAVTSCGCIELDGRKNTVTFEKKKDGSQIRGVLCEDCRAGVEKEIGENLYYIVSLCNSLNLSLDKIIAKELERVKALGKYNLM